MTQAGKHHTSALCHTATTLLTRIAACWRNGTPYQLRDLDGRPITAEQARLIIAERYTVPAELRHTRSTHTVTGRRSKESQRAPSTGPAPDNATTPGAAFNGACYRSRDFAAALADTATVHKRTRPYRPQTNGKVERFKCATRRLVVSPAQPGGTRREVPGSDPNPRLAVRFAA